LVVAGKKPTVVDERSNDLSFGPFHLLKELLGEATPSLSSTRRVRKKESERNQLL
jgi:hypothetical protein